MLKDFERILKNPLKNYDSDTTDLFLTALGSAFQVNVIIFQSDEKECWIVDQTSEETEFEDTLYFARTLSPHVDPVVPSFGIKKEVCFKDFTYKLYKKEKGTALGHQDLSFSEKRYRIWDYKCINAEFLYT